MKSNFALNKVDPNSPLNIKLRKIHDAKQAINNSDMSEDVKRAMMSVCDSQKNQAWRWHYEGKAGYEADLDSRARVKRVLTKLYGMRIETTEQSELYATSDTLKMMLVAQNLGTTHQWMLRIYPREDLTFERWENPPSIEKFFDCPEQVAIYLEENVARIYKKALESLTRDVQDVKKTIDKMESDYIAIRNKLGEKNEN